MNNEFSVEKAITETMPGLVCALIFDFWFCYFCLNDIVIQSYNVKYNSMYISSVNMTTSTIAGLFYNFIFIKMKGPNKLLKTELN